MKERPLFAAYVTGEGQEQQVVLEGEAVRAAILPAHGANWCSFVFEGREYLLGPENATGFHFGTPVLFPCPNRVRDCVFTWNGRSYPQQKNGEARYLHGLVYDEPFSVARLEANSEAAKAVLSLTPSADSDILKSFPFPFTLTLIFTLSENKMQLDVAVDNLGNEDMPFGFAIHPYFLRHGKDVQIRVPAEYRYEAIDLLPTGKLLPVAGSPYDLLEMRTVADLDLDDVYCGMSSDKTADIVYPSFGTSLQLQADDVYGRAVVYTPPTKPIFCIENQTCSTDAHNLYARGLREESGLLVLPAGERWTSKICLSIKKDA